MRQRFQILNDPRFRLVYDEKRRFFEGPDPATLRLNIEHFKVADGIKKKTRVFPGMLLATHASLDKGDLHSPIYGIVSDINARSIFVDAVKREADDPVLEPRDFLEEGREGEELRWQMKEMGVNMRSLGQKVKTLIINGLNPDPGVTWAESILQTHANNLRHGKIGRAHV